MEEGTSSSPIFENIASELVQLLEPYSDPEARSMRYEAKQLLEIFRGWARKRPSSDDRITLINHLLSLQRTAMEFHTNRPPSSRVGLLQPAR